MRKGRNAVTAILMACMWVCTADQVRSQGVPPNTRHDQRITHNQRKAAALRAGTLRAAKAQGTASMTSGANKTTAAKTTTGPLPAAMAAPMAAPMNMPMPMPGEAPHYYGPYPNYANSPLPSNAVLDWHQVAIHVIHPEPMPGMPMMMSGSMSEAFVLLSYVQTAVYDALVAIEGGYQPYNALPAADPNTSRDAAIATAAYSVLVHYFPMDPAKSMLDGHYASSLAAIPDGPNKTAGIAVGQDAAAAIIAERANDGRGATGTYTVLPPGPGVWEPTATMPNGMPAPPVDPWMAQLQPLMINSPSQFRPAAPPALTSAEYATQLNEVKAIGSAMSMSRTPEQSQVAQFWTTNMVHQYSNAFRDLATRRNLGLLDTARLLAMGNMVAVDAIVATYDSKYNYSFWRPVTAIRRAGTDNNPATTADTAWMPYIMTPNHPEYVAGHAAFASAMAEVFTQFLGSAQIDIDLSSTVTGTTRHYVMADDLRLEVINARVWGGIHYRGSCELGATLGQQVAQYALQNFFGPAPSLATHVVQSGGMRKFVDGLPLLGPAGANNLGQYIPVAVADESSYSGSDYYEIAVVQYREQMHSDLPPTLLRGYVQLETAVNAGVSNHVALSNANLDGTSTPILLNGNPVYAVDAPHYLGPLIAATKDKPVRILFRNLLPTGQGGDLFIPVDTTVMGAGPGPDMDMHMAMMNPQLPMCGDSPKPMGCYTENRATLHLHGGITPWISDGTPHQWITPAGENTMYPEGVSVQNVPDMPDPGPGAMTFFYSNQQSARLMFYHDHSWGITRLNVYAGEAAPYLITDAAEQALIDQGIIPAEQIPLVVQDKTFVPNMSQLAQQDPTWDMARWGGLGQLWVPHVYVPAQNPGDSSGVNQFGRWAYGPWFWPPTVDVDYGPIPNPYYDPTCDPDVQWCEPLEIPGVPYVSMGMEAFNDTPVVNGTAYPTLTVEPKAYRFRILNAANDRFFNMSLYVADATGTEVALNPAEVTAALDDPAGIFPTPDTSVSPPGPDWIQIGTEGGFLPAPAVIPPGFTTWVTDPTVFNAGNVDQHSLLLGPAERVDVIVDFSAFAGQTLILYNDAPAAFPARDPRYDYYTGNADLVDTGGTPPTLPGYGPNTRTMMQIKVAAAAPAPAFNLAVLEAAFTHKPDGSGVFESAQNPIIVGQSAYNSAYGTAFKTNGPTAGLVQIHDRSFTFDTLLGSSLTFPLQPKQIQDEMGEAFEKEYGRMSGFLGVEAPGARANFQNMILYPFVNPPTEIFDGIELPPGTLDVTPIASADDGSQIWMITHNGVDTHPVHFHLYDVQLINRVGWDGIIRRPDPNELGWKDTVRVSPLENTIVAMRPVVPKQPFGIPDSIRPLNPMMPLGSTAMFNSTDTNGNPINPPITNELFNFGWEYVWHCHILSHEEMDMMRPVSVFVSRELPTAPDVNMVAGAGQVSFSWSDPTDPADPLTWGNPANEIGFRIERTTWEVGEFQTVFNSPANTTSYTDTGINPSDYFYRVVAWNAAGDSPSQIMTLGQYPASPTDLTATAPAPRRVDLVWAYTQGTYEATGFRIDRAMAVDGVAGPWGTVATVDVNTTTLVDRSALEPLTTYSYRVIALNAAGGSLPSNIATIETTVDLIPDPPANLTATAAGLTQVNLAWSYTAGAFPAGGFRIERAFAANGPFTPLGTVAADVLVFSDLAAPDSVALFYRVLAFNTGGDSLPSNVATVQLALAAPSNAAVTMSAMPPLVLTLTWTDNSSSETSYTIERATNASFSRGRTTFILPANTTSYADTTVGSRTTYYYRVRTDKVFPVPATSSAWSNVVSINTSSPSSPSNLRMTASTQTTVSISWQDRSNNETGFTVQRARNTNFTQNLATFQVGPNVTTFTDTGLTANMRYYYRVRAYNGAGNSNWSSHLTATTRR